MESYRPVCERRQLQFPTRYEQACTIDTAESFSEIFNAAEAQVKNWLDCRARITSKELAPNPFCENSILQNACSTSPKRRRRFAEKCSYAHCPGDEQPSKRSQKNGDKSAVNMLKKYELHDRTVQPVVNRDTRHESNHGPSNTRQLGCVFSRYGAAEVFIDFAGELKHTEANPMCSIHQSRVTSC